jgi:hypothetical protein
MADPVAIQDEIAVLEKRIEEAQTQLKDARERLQKAQDAAYDGPGANLSEQEKMDLIKVNLQEVLNPEIMEEALKKNGHLKVYWGTATTGRPHCGYVRTFTTGEVACYYGWLTLCRYSSYLSLRLLNSSLLAATLRSYSPTSTASSTTSKRPSSSSSSAPNTTATPSRPY